MPLSESGFAIIGVYMRKHFKDFGRVLALLVVDSIFFSAINPAKAYALVVIVGFGLLVLTIYAVIDLLLLLVVRIVPLSDLLRKRILTSGTMLLGLLIAMQSIGQLTVKDMFALVPLVLVLGFYLSYQTKQKRS